MALDFVAFALMAATCYAIANILDKIIMTDHVERPMTKAFYGGIMAPFVALPAFFLGGQVIPSPKVLGLSLLAGLSFFMTVILIMRAMQLEEVSRLALLKQLTPIFVVGLSFLMLEEVLSINQYMGIGVLVFAGLISSLDHPKQGIPSLKFNKPFLLVITSNLFAAFSFVLLKYLLNFQSFWTILYWEQFGLFIAAPFVLLAGSKYRAEVKDILFRKPKALGLLVATTTALMSATLSLTAGFSKASASIVASINTINPLFTLIFVIVLQRIGFEQFEEHLSRTEILVKTFATLMFVAGIYLVR
jgi:drug/metabolite transporter (DMT)-like permease